MINPIGLKSISNKLDICMVKNILVLLLASIGVFTTSAQNAQQKSVSDKNADKLLSTISKRYKAFKSIKADFVYTVESKADKAN
jgi:outer membrane lipoprotein-sorting protein